MKLSIQILFEMITFSDTRLVTSQNIKLNLSGIHFFHKNNALSDEFIYLINAQQLISLKSQESASFICLGDIDETQLPSQWSVIIMPSQSDKIEIFEVFQVIFDRYHNWSSRIDDYIFNGQPLQTIFDAACAHLKNPVALFDDSQGLLMYTSLKDPDKVDAIWKHVLDKGYSFKEADSIALNENFKSEHMPFYYQSPDSFGNIKRLIAPITVNGQIFGSLGMTELICPFTDSEFTNLYLVQQMIENALKINDEFRKNHEAPWYIYRLLNKTYIDSNILAHHLEQKGKKINDPFLLWCFSPSSQINNLNGYINQLSKLFNKRIIFSYHSEILVCDYEMLLKKSDKTEPIRNFLLKNEFQATTSMVFNNLFELNLAYAQCQVSKEFSDERAFKITFFEDIYSDFVLNILDKNTELDLLITPQLKNLNMNDPYTKELLLCLSAYIVNGKNISAAATTLNIHRHTVVYRLKNIEKLTGLNYEKIQDHALFQLFLSCNILLR
ncbi:helix-turn-helix domain-containing protein [Eubacteriaceae bacterium ES3]|nr:helix-turn-helix domain-containing protein [Eubacteriaceae bacterium ES3]